MTKKKLLMILALVVVVGGVGAKMFLLPKKAQAKERINGTIYVLPKGFELNLAGGKYVTLTVALVLAPGQSTDATAATEGQTTPAGFGTLTEEPVIRAIITGAITNDRPKELLGIAGRNRLRTTILRGIKHQTDVKVNQLYFTDLAVQ